MPAVGNVMVGLDCPQHGPSSHPYEVGDRVVVTGDRAEWRHSFNVGEVVTVTRTLNWETRCENPETGVSWWVHLVDLEPYGDSDA